MCGPFNWLLFAQVDHNPYGVCIRTPSKFGHIFIKWVKKNQKSSIYKERFSGGLFQKLQWLVENLAHHHPTDDTSI